MKCVFTQARSELTL